MQKATKRKANDTYTYIPIKNFVVSSRPVEGVYVQRYARVQQIYKRAYAHLFDAAFATSHRSGLYDTAKESKIIREALLECKSLFKPEHAERVFKYEFVVRGALLKIRELFAPRQNGSEASASRIDTILKNELELSQVGFCLPVGKVKNGYYEFGRLGKIPVTSKVEAEFVEFFPSQSDQKVWIVREFFTSRIRELDPTNTKKAVLTVNREDLRTPLAVYVEGSKGITAPKTADYAGAILISNKEVQNIFRAYSKELKSTAYINPDIARRLRYYQLKVELAAHSYASTLAMSLFSTYRRIAVVLPVTVSHANMWRKMFMDVLVKELTRVGALVSDIQLNDQRFFQFSNMAYCPQCKDLGTTYLVGDEIRCRKAGHKNVNIYEAAIVNSLRHL